MARMANTTNTTDGHDEHKTDVPNFGDSTAGSLLDPKNDGDWDIPALTFPSIDESARNDHDDASLSFPYVPEQDDATARLDALTDMPAVPAPQATSTSETTVLPPVGTGSAEPDAGTVGTDDGVRDGADAATAAAQPEVSPRKKFLIGLGAIAVIAAVAGVTAFSYIQRTGNEARFNAALDSCETAAHDADKADDALAAALKKAKSARNVTADQLADSSTLAKLSDAIDATQTSDTTRTSDSTQACSTTLTAAELDARAKQNAKVASTLTSSTKTLESATKAVTDSQAKKDEADAAQVKQDLQQAVSDAQTLLTNSEGAVADDATRQTLQAAVDKANKLLKESKPKASDLKQALTDIQNATTAVNESMNAAASTTTQNNTGASQGTTGNGYGNGYGNTGYNYGYGNYNYGYTGNGNTGTTGGSSNSGNTGNSNRQQRELRQQRQLGQQRRFRQLELGQLGQYRQYRQLELRRRHPAGFPPGLHHGRGRVADFTAQCSSRHLHWWISECRVRCTNE